MVRAAVSGARKVTSGAPHWRRAACSGSGLPEWLRSPRNEEVSMRPRTAQRSPPRSICAQDTSPLRGIVPYSPKLGSGNLRWGIRQNYSPHFPSRVEPAVKHGDLGRTILPFRPKVEETADCWESEDNPALRDPALGWISPREPAPAGEGNECHLAGMQEFRARIEPLPARRIHAALPVHCCPGGSRRGGYPRYPGSRREANGRAASASASSSLFSSGTSTLPGNLIPVLDIP